MISSLLSGRACSSLIDNASSSTGIIYFQIDDIFTSAKVFIITYIIIYVSDDFIYLEYIPRVLVDT